MVEFFKKRKKGKGTRKTIQKKKKKKEVRKRKGEARPGPCTSLPNSPALWVHVVNTWKGRSSLTEDF